MSSGCRGRGRGGGNPLATPFNPSHSELPTSSDDPRMEEDSPSPVNTAATHPSTSVHDGEPTSLESLQDETNTLINHNKSLADCYQFLLKIFQALEKHLMVVQNIILRIPRTSKIRFPPLPQNFNAFRANNHQEPRPSPSHKSQSHLSPPLPGPRKLLKHPLPFLLPFHKTRNLLLLF